MATTLKTVRTAIETALLAVTGAQSYRRRPINPQFPCVVVGWPDEFDVRPVHGDSRDMTIPVFVGVLAVDDDDSTDDALSALLESTVDALLGNETWDILPATDFGTELLGDERTAMWARLPVRVLT